MKSNYLYMFKKKELLVFFGLIVFCFSCNFNDSFMSSNYIDVSSLKSDSVEYINSCGKNPLKSYLPLELIGNKQYKDLDSLTIELYSMLLKYSIEPVLYYKHSEDFETYRLVWAPSFSFPKIFRIENKSGNILLVSSTYTTDSIFESDLLSSDDALLFVDTQKLSTIEWNEFKIIIDSISFWNYSTYFKEMVFDGESYFIEGRDHNKYKFIEMHNPDSTVYTDVKSILDYCIKHSVLFEFEMNHYISFVEKSIIAYNDNKCLSNLDTFSQSVSKLDFIILYYHNQSITDQIAPVFEEWNFKLRNVLLKQIFNFDELLSIQKINKITTEEGRNKQYLEADKSVLDSLLLDFRKIVEKFEKCKKNGY